VPIVVGVAGDAEVQELYLLAHRNALEEDVFGFEVAVDDPLRMCASQRWKDRGEPCEGVRVGHIAAPKALRQSLPVEELHREEGKVRAVGQQVHAGVVDAHDAWVFEARRQPSLPQEALVNRCVAGQEPIEHFHGHLLFGYDVPCNVERAHATDGEETLHTILLSDDPIGQG
jgi:hypothetical protein